MTSPHNARQAANPSPGPQPNRTKSERSEEPPTPRLWGGRFEGRTDALIERLNNSLAFDARLWRQDIEGSIAHAAMLGATGIIPQDEAMQIVAGLKALADDLEN